MSQNEATLGQELYPSGMDQIHMASQKGMCECKRCICLCAVCAAFYVKRAATSCGCAMCEAVLAVHLAKEASGVEY